MKPKCICHRANNFLPAQTCDVHFPTGYDRPTFRAKFLTDGSTALHCKQTDVRYIIAQAGNDHAAYRDGQLIRTGDRATCVDAVESDARWGMRA